MALCRSHLRADLFNCRTTCLEEKGAGVRHLSRAGRILAPEKRQVYIAGVGLWWGAMANWFQFQITNPGSPTDFVVEPHRRLANDLNSEQPGLPWNHEFLIDRRRGHCSLEPSECYIQTRGQLSIGYLKSNSLVGGQALCSDGRVQTIRARRHRSYLGCSREVKILCACEADAKGAVTRPSGRAVTGDINALSVPEVPIEWRWAGRELEVPIEKVIRLPVVACARTQVPGPCGHRQVRMALLHEKACVLSCQAVIGETTLGDPAPSALRIIQTSGLHQVLQPGFYRPPIFRKPVQQDIFRVIDQTCVLAEDD